MTGIGSYKRKWIIYGVLAVGLVVANVMRWQSNPTDVVGIQGRQEPAVVGLPVLLTADEFQRPGESQRDLFLKFAPVKEPVMAPVQVEAVRVQPDPMDLLRERGNALLDSIEVRGIMSAPEGPVAMVHYDGVVSLLRNGEDLIPGYTIIEISNTQLRIVNETLSIQKLYTVGETDRE